MFKAKAAKIQGEYVWAHGGYGNVREADEKYNDLSRKTILEYKKHFPNAVIGRINGRASDEKFFEIDPDCLYNFCCDFVIPKPDETLERLLNEWRDGTGWRKVKEITDRVTEIGGELILWS